MIMNRVFRGLVCAVGLAGACQAREFPGLSLRGPTGLVLVPTGQLQQADQFDVGLHRGVLKAGYGILGVAEVGIATPDVFDSPKQLAWRGQTTGFAKVGLRTGGAWWIPGVAAGAENSIWNMARPSARVVL